MKTGELLELNNLIQIIQSVKAPSLAEDGRRIVTTEDGCTYDFDRIEQRAKELLNKFVERYKVEE